MKVLLVEDDKEVRQLLSRSLKSERFCVHAVADGEAGWKLAKKNAYDLIILDYMLPKRSGVEVCSLLRAEGINTHIIGLSVRGEVDSKVSLLDAGADDYMTKPFSFTELLARMRAIKRRPAKAMDSNTLAVGDIELDPVKHSVNKSGKKIYLTRKEFSLLQYLLENRGSTMTRQMILERVWDVNADPFSNTIETHIMTLRRKIDPDKNTRIIRTVSGIGYTID